MARPVSTSGTPRKSNRSQRLLLTLGAALLAVAAAIAIFVLVVPGPGKGGSGGTGSGEMTLDYTTEQGQSATVGTVNSPLRITLRVPYSGFDDTMVNTATVQLLDESGSPADFGGKPSQPLTLQPTYELGVWDYAGSMPSKPGKYRAHVEMTFRVVGGKEQPPQERDFATKLLQAVPESGAPLASGFVFTQNANLWILSTDTRKQRRLTFFSTDSEYAYNAAWSPDGKTIVFAHTPQQDPSQLPASDIWTMNADGTGAKVLIAHGDNESLYEPGFSPDGKYVYFTAEKLDMASTNYDANGQPVGDRGIDRYELATGTRTHWKDNSHMPVWGGPDGSILYLGTPPSTDASTAPGVRLVRQGQNSDQPVVLADDSAFTAFFGPTISPDGSRVVFAGIPAPPKTAPGGFDLFKWLTFQPETAYAHGLPWDLYLVAADGKSQPIRLTNMSEDQPQAAWLDNNTIAFMGVTGLYKLQIAPNGNSAGKPVKIHDGAPHGGLTWHAP